MKQSTLFLYPNMTQKPLTQNVKFIDLFAGIGGFHLAFHNAGKNIGIKTSCVFASEWDEAARKTYFANFYNTEPELFDSGNYAGDITKVEAKKIPNFDILTGGFPCQPFSHAGFKKGFADSRGTLFHNIADIIKEKQPKAFFLENVSHLLKHDDGRTFATIKKIIEEDLGYSFYHKIVRASDFNLPQHRARLFMVGFKDRTIPFRFPDPIKLTKSMSDIFNGNCPKVIGYTLRVGGRGSGIKDRRNWDSYLVDGKVKRLTPKEGKKMMGFPSNFKFPVTETQAMKQLGNAVAVSAIQAVAEEIINVLQKYAPGKQRRMERILRVPEVVGR